MAYTHTQYQINLTATDIDANAGIGVAGNPWAPGFVSHHIRAFSIINTTTVADTSDLVAVLQRRTLGSVATGIGLATINGTALSAGIVIYKNELNATVAPGEELELNITTAANSATLIQATVWVEPIWEEPGNNTSMKATT